mmetsp:Transcript_11577/g.23979  ORF Transcript_11577/g.23979 Transcript_11577/m.23979 type:complete len:281 (+) Transcript_11577:30-872(+)
MTVQHPCSEEHLQELARGLSLAGMPLEPPRILETGWREGQRFRPEDDPDRTLEPWEPPASLLLKDPVAQRAKTSATDLAIQGTWGAESTSFARIVRGVLDEEDCAALVACINRKGFTPALLNVGGGEQMFSPGDRDGHRVISDSPALTEWLLEALRPHLPEQHRGGRLVDLNDRCRFLCYTPGQYFVSHYDGRYTRPRGHKNAGDYSLVTLQLYLHDVPASNGGATTFIDRREQPILECQPGAGDVLIFTQDLYHEGSLLAAGLKYTVRTEAMYRRIPLA